MVMETETGFRYTVGDILLYGGKVSAFLHADGH